MARGELNGLRRQPQRPVRSAAGRIAEEGRVFTNTEYPPDPRGRDFRDRPASGASLLALLGFISLPMLVGAAGAAGSADSIRGWYMSLSRPPGTPPDWAFGAVWTALYVLMGAAAWLVWRAATRGPLLLDGTLRLSGGRNLRPLRLWGWQLLVNAAWAPAFFGMHRPGLALLIMPALLGLVAATTVAFWRVRPAAGALLLPYLAWTCYAGYLTAGFWWLNQHV